MIDYDTETFLACTGHAYTILRTSATNESIFQQKNVLNSNPVPPAFDFTPLLDLDGTGTRAREGLDGNDLEVEVLVAEAVLGPVESMN